MDLSRPAVLLLGLVAERPQSAYDMVKVLEQVQVRRWLPLADATVYLTVKTLARRKLIEGRPVREGNMPEKIVYTITPTGSDALRETLGAYLAMGDAVGSEFDIATLLACHMDRETVIGILEQRKGRLSAEIERARGQGISLEQDPRVPFLGRQMVRHNLYLKEADLKATIEFLEGARLQEQWDSFVSHDLGPVD